LKVKKGSGLQRKMGGGGGYGTVINPSLEDTLAIKFCFSHKPV